MERNVSMVMDPGLLISSQNTPVKGIARLMSDHNLRIVILVDDSWAPAGLVTATDLLRVWGQDIQNLPVSKVMQPGILSVSAGSSLRQAVEMMVDNQVHRLVVHSEVPNGAGGTRKVPVGLVGADEIVREMARPGSSWWPES